MPKKIRKCGTYIEVTSWFRNVGTFDRSVRQHKRFLQDTATPVVSHQSSSAETRRDTNPSTIETTSRTLITVFILISMLNAVAVAFWLIPA